MYLERMYIKSVFSARYFSEIGRGFDLSWELAFFFSFLERGSQRRFKIKFYLYLTWKKEKVCSFEVKTWHKIKCNLKLVGYC